MRINAFRKKGNDMYRIVRAMVFACVCCSVAAPAAAQSDVRANEWSRATDIVGFAGMTMNGSASAVLGGAVGWQVTPVLAIEGNAGWFDYGQDTSAFSGAMRARIQLFGSPKFAPLVHGGIGLYRATFGPNATSVPEFYQRRLTTSQGISARSFTDPAIVGGGGLNLSLNRHVALRPDATAMLVFDDGHTHVVTTVTLNLVFRFESHPVTPRTR
jgi:hypothetical protein